MKVNDLKKIIREEVTKVVRKELVGFVKLLSESNKPKTKPKKKLKKKVVTEKSLKNMLGEFENDNFETKTPQQHYSNNPVLNDILNETKGHDEYPTMGGGTYDKSRMAEMMGYGANAFGQQASPMTTPEGAPITNVPDPVAKAMTRNYGDLMKAIDKKKQGSPLKPS